MITLSKSRFKKLKNLSILLLAFSLVMALTEIPIISDILSRMSSGEASADFLFDIITAVFTSLCLVMIAVLSVFNINSCKTLSAKYDNYFTENKVISKSDLADELDLTEKALTKELAFMVKSKREIRTLKNSETVQFLDN